MYQRTHKMDTPQEYYCTFIKDNVPAKIWLLAHSETHARHQVDELYEPDHILRVYLDNGMW